MAGDRYDDILIINLYWYCYIIIFGGTETETEFYY